MELEQLHEAGSSQAEQRAAAEDGIAKLSAKVSQLEDVVRGNKALFEEADGERGGHCSLYCMRFGAGGSQWRWGRGRGGRGREGLPCWTEVGRALGSCCDRVVRTSIVVRLLL